MKKIFIASFALATFIVACKSSKETASVTPVKPLDCTTKGLSFATDIKPIMEANCTKCHGKSNPADGLDFNTIEATKKAALKGELLGTIKHDKGFPKMPAMAAKMDQSSIDKIECWMNNGMKD